MNATKAAHTPGPWNYWAGIAYAQGVVTQDRTAGHVAIPVEMPDDGVMVANARLIAAAPELLEIAEAIDEDIGYYGGGAKLSPHFLGRLRAAIAKARGE